MEQQDKHQELQELQQRVERLESEIAQGQSIQPWQPTEFYGAYYATTGFMLGIFGAVTSLLVNVVGAPLAGKNPLELIRIYLTFPLGEKALELTSADANVYAIGDGVIMTIGCCLYLGTGMLLGVPFYYFLVRLSGDGGLGKRLVIASVLAVVLWVINFYGILSWLQPLLFKGNWITDPAYLPPWVAIVTHLVFGWTLALLYPLGQYSPRVMHADTK